MTAISSAVIDKFVQLLSCINTITKQDIEQILHHIIDPVCKSVDKEGTDMNR